MWSRATRPSHPAKSVWSVARVSLGGGRDALLEHGTKLRGSEQTRNQVVALLGAEWLERDRRRVRLAAAPAGPDVEQLLPGKADEQDGRLAERVGQVIDEFEQRGL